MPFALAATGGAGAPATPFDCSLAHRTIKEPKFTDAILYMLCPLQSAIWLGLFFVGAVLIILILYGGIKALMSTGDARQLEGAKMVWTYAILGTLVVLLSVFIIQIAFNLLGSSNNPFSLTGKLGNTLKNFLDSMSFGIE
jgi:hypothetical protein